MWHFYATWVRYVAQWWHGGPMNTYPIRVRPKRAVTPRQNYHSDSLSEKKDILRNDHSCLCSNTRKTIIEILRLLMAYNEITHSRLLSRNSFEMSNFFTFEKFLTLLRTSSIFHREAHTNILFPNQDVTNNFQFAQTSVMSLFVHIIIYTLLSIC